MGHAAVLTGPPAPRARMPRGERRAQILAIAQDMFARCGFHHIAMDDIADRAGISKPILYRHFASKLDLYLSVVDAQADQLVRSVRTRVDEVPAPPDGVALVDATVRAYVEYARDAGVAASLLFESDVMRDAAVRARVLAPHDTVADLLAARLGPLAGLAPTRALVVARICTGIARSAVAQAEHDPAPAVRAFAPRFAWTGLQGMLDTPVADVDVPDGTTPPAAAIVHGAPADR